MVTAAHIGQQHKAERMIMGIELTILALVVQCMSYVHCLMLPSHPTKLQIQSIQCFENVFYEQQIILLSCDNYKHNWDQI